MLAMLNSIRHSEQQRQQETEAEEWSSGLAVTIVPPIFRTKLYSLKFVYKLITICIQFVYKFLYNLYTISSSSRTRRWRRNAAPAGAQPIEHYPGY